MVRTARPALGDRGARPDAIDEDLVQRRHDHLEPLQPDAGGDQRGEQLLRRGTLGELDLAVGSLGMGPGARGAALGDPGAKPSEMMPSAASRRWRSASRPSSSFLPRAMMQMWSTSFSACSIWWVEN